MPTKFHNDRAINSLDILTFQPLENKKKEKEEKTSYRSFQIYNLETLKKRKKRIIEVSKFSFWKLKNEL